MRRADLLGLAVSALYQQKVRSALTTLGVVIGTFVLVGSLSIGQGVHEVTMNEFRRHDRLRTITVWPGYRVEQADISPEQAEKLRVPGVMSAARRERLRQAILRHWQGSHSNPTLNRFSCGMAPGCRLD